MSHLDRSSSHPDVLEAVRDEIIAQSPPAVISWDMDSIATLEKLDSAIKETAKLTPGTLVVNSRIVQQHHTIAG